MPACVYRHKQYIYTCRYSRYRKCYKCCTMKHSLCITILATPPSHYNIQCKIHILHSIPATIRQDYTTLATLHTLHHTHTPFRQWAHNFWMITDKRWTDTVNLDILSNELQANQNGSHTKVTQRSPCPTDEQRSWGDHTLRCASCKGRPKT